MLKSKQVLIDERLHRLLKVRVAELGIPTMKAYLEALIEHSINTHWVPSEPVSGPGDMADVSPHQPSLQDEEEIPPENIQNTPVVVSSGNTMPDDW